MLKRYNDEVHPVVPDEVRVYRIKVFNCFGVPLNNLHVPHLADSQHRMHALHCYTSSTSPLSSVPFLRYIQSSGTYALQTLYSYIIHFVFKDSFFACSTKQFYTIMETCC